MPPTDAITRTYSAAAHPQAAQASLDQHTATITRAVATITTPLAQTAAATITTTWAPALRRAIRDHNTTETTRLSTLIAATIVGVETNPPLAIALPGGPDQARQALADHLATTSLTKAEVSTILTRERTTRATTPSGTTWVSYAPDTPIPTLGWVGLDGRLTGAPTTPMSETMVIPCANVLSRGMGTGEKTDPAPIAERAHTLLDGLADPTLTTLRELGDAIMPADVTARDGAAWESWLTRDLAGRAPSVVMALRGLPANTPLDATTPGATALRSTLTTKASDWAATWDKRVREAAQQAQGGLLAGTWLGTTIAETTRLPYFSGPYTDILATAAENITSHRQRLRETASAWAQATTTLNHPQPPAVQAALDALDDFAATHDHLDTPRGPAVAARAAKHLPALIAAYTTAPADQRTEQAAASLGVQWRDWARFVAAWITGDGTGAGEEESARGEALAKAMEVHDARRALTAPLPALARPTSDHPAIPVYARGRWRGRIHSDGTLDLTIATPGGYREVTIGWSSRRITTALDLRLAARPHHAHTEDTTRLRISGTEASEKVPTRLLESAPFTLAPRTAGGWEMKVTVTRPAPVVQKVQAQTVMGVSLSDSRDATWSVWRTLPGVTAAPEVTHLGRNDEAGVPRPARRIGPEGCGTEFAHPVREKTVRVGDPDGGWATQEHLEGAAEISRVLHDVRVPRPPSGRVRRTDLSAWADTALGAAVTGQRALAEFARLRASSDPARARQVRARGQRLLAALDRSWPLSEEERGMLPSHVWGHRRSALNHALAVKGRTLLPGSGQGLTLARVAEFDRHLALMRQSAAIMAPGASRASQVPEGLGAGMAHRRDCLGEAWAREVASQIVEAAVAEGASTISIAQGSGSSLLGGPDLTGHVRAQVTAQVRHAAQARGVRVVEVPLTAEHPITGVPLPVPVAAVTAAKAVRMRQEDPVWARQVAMAKADPQAWSMVLRAEDVLARLDAEAQASGDREAWDERAKRVIVHLPHPAGTYLAAADAHYEADDALPLGGLAEAKGLHLTGLQDRGVVAASQAALTALAAAVEDL